MSKRILAVHAHPDDAEILAGGTLALLAGLGHQVTIVSLTPGDCGTTEYPPEEIAALRRQEAARAAALIKARYQCAEFRDLAIFNDDAARRRVVELLRGARPDLILTSSFVDYHCDHETTGSLVRDACFALSAPNYATGAANAAAALEAIPHLYIMDPAGGVDREAKPVTPDFVVDVSSVFALKREMVAQHSSQREWLRRQHGMDEYLRVTEDWTRAAGRRAGKEFGEGFRQYKGHPYPQSPLLQELLGPQLVCNL